MDAPPPQRGLKPKANLPSIQSTKDNQSTRVLEKFAGIPILLENKQTVAPETTPYPGIIPHYFMVPNFATSKFLLFLEENEVLHRIYSKWLGTNSPAASFHANPLSSFSFVAIPFILIIGIVFCWNRLLERKVSLRTKELEEKEEEYSKLLYQFKALLDAISDPIALFSSDFKTVWTNKSYEIETQTASKSQTSLKDSFFGSHFASDHVFLTKCFETGNTIEAEMKSADQKIWEIKAYPLKNDEGETVQVIAKAIDVTEKYQLREESARSAQLASLGELSAGIAHEINNPNSIILLNIPILKQVLNDAMPLFAQYYSEHGDFPLGQLNYSTMEKELPRLTERIEESGLRIKRIVEDLKNFVTSRSTQNQTKVNINEVVEAALRLLNNAIKKCPATTSVDYTPNLPSIRGNFQRLEQVVINLLLNACQSVHDSSQSIKISTGQNPDSNAVTITIEDSGPGIPQEIQHRLNEPFFTTKRPNGHAGLGLSVAFRTVQEHKGRIEIQSSLGKGTKFTIILPTIPEENHEPRLS